jgi:hypothetical protein
MCHRIGSVKTVLNRLVPCKAVDRLLAFQIGFCHQPQDLVSAHTATSVYRSTGSSSRAPQGQFDADWTACVRDGQ